MRHPNHGQQLDHLWRKLNKITCSSKRKHTSKALMDLLVQARAINPRSNYEIIDKENIINNIKLALQGGN